MKKIILSSISSHRYFPITLFLVSLILSLSAFFNDPNSGNRVEYTGPHGWRLVDEEGYERQSVYDKFSRGEVRGNYGNLKIDVPLGADVDRDVLDAASDGLDYFLQHADELKLVEQSTDQGGQTPSMPTAPPTQPAPSV